jgi:hypothetical protein
MTSSNLQKDRVKSSDRSSERRKWVTPALARYDVRSSIKGPFGFGFDADGRQASGLGS